MTYLYTTLGPKRADELGMILPHEHIFVDLRTWDQPGYGEAEPGDVVVWMGPELEAAQAAGVTALVGTRGPIGVGRRGGYPETRCRGDRVPHRLADRHLS